MKLKLRDFQRHFNRYKKITCLVVDGEGRSLGTWQPTTCDSHAVISLKAALEGLALGKVDSQDSGIAPTRDSQASVCGKCKVKGKIVATWDGWNDITGEEIINLPLCGKCAKGRKDIKWK